VPFTSDSLPSPLPRLFRMSSLEVNAYHMGNVPAGCATCSKPMGVLKLHRVRRISLFVVPLWAV